MLSLLATASTDTRVARDLVRLFYAQSRYSLISGSILVAVQSLYAAPREGAAVWLAWALAFYALIAVRARWRGHVLAASDAALNEAMWRRRAVLSSGAAGLLWALALALNFDAAEAFAQMFCVVLVCLTCVASVNVMAPLPTAFCALLVGPILSLAGLFALLRGDGMGVGIALLTLLAGVLALGLLRAHHRLLVDGLTLRDEREQLLQQAQAAREAQVRFLAAASHDLRQPVHALGLLAAQSKEEQHGRRSAQTAAQLEQMAGALDALIGHLLDISRLDGGAIQPQARPMPLAPLLERLAPEFAVLAEAKGLQWRLHPSALWVHSDPALLERMLRNLLANALRYTQQGGVLLAARARADGQVWLCVWDTGCGIPAAQQERVFDEFVQLHNPGRDRRLGHGLGLAIVARLARLLGHRVLLRSRLERGSCFRIELPRAAALAVDLTDAHTAKPLPQPLQGRRLALVEDDDAVREATCSLLRTWGCQVWAEATVAPLLQHLQREHAELDGVISDWRLPEGDGLLAIDALRALAGRPLPALLLTGETLPMSPAVLKARHVLAARKPLPAAALRAWLSSAEFR